MSKLDQFDPKTRKTLRVIAIFAALVLLAAVVHACSGPAQAQLAGRNPTPEHFFAVRVVDQAGRTVGGANLAALPPIGYHWQGREIVGGSVDRAQRDTPSTSVNLTQATVIVR